MKSYKMSYLCRKVTVFVFLVMLCCTSFIISHAEDSEREIKIKQVAELFNDKNELTLTRTRYFKITGNGNFVIYSYKTTNDTGISVFSYLFSDKVFTGLQSDTGRAGSDWNGVGYYAYNGVYYAILNSFLSELTSASCNGYANLKLVSTYDDIPTPQEIIDSGTLDLTKDSYLSSDELEKSAVYNSSLDLTSFGAHAYQKWSVKREPDNSGWNFITDEEAGTRYDWTYKTEVEGSYIKFTYYGNYYEKMFDPVYTDGVLSLSGDGQPNVVSMSYARSLKEKMIYTKADLYNALYAKYGYSKIFAFETKYVYAQCFGYVDGEFCRSRTYRVNYDMVKEDGDTWILEPTGSDPLPSEYFPDDSNPTPKPSDPDPDPGEWKDTTPNPLPPNSTDPDFPTDNSLLNALKWLYETLNGLKDSLGAFPSLVNSVFGFLPQPVILLLGASIILVVIMRFAGR